MKSTSPLALIILDGFGYSQETRYNAIAQAKKPHLDSWLTKYPNTLIHASGNSVGLPEGYIGNSEVGHITIGSGRIIKQPALVINESINNGDFFTNPTLHAQLAIIKEKNSFLHLMGLFSDAGVHSLESHLFAFLRVAKMQGITNIIIHPFLDGRDVPPKSAQRYLEQLEQFLKEEKISAHISSIHGRFYAMDRDNHWDRTQKSYDALTQVQISPFSSWQELLHTYYAQGITEEFIPPTQLQHARQIQHDDGIIFFNFRPDRARQLTASFIENGFNKFPTRQIILSWFITPYAYSNTLHTTALFQRDNIPNTLHSILMQHGKTMFAIAETEKYAHITYFFNGGTEEISPHETRVLIPSVPVTTFAEHPEMSASAITQEVLTSLRNDPKDFYLINYANADMVGHSGNFNATVQAIECLDKELKKLYDQLVTTMHGTMIITADHGKAEAMLNQQTGEPITAHTNDPVPFLVINNERALTTKKLSVKELADIAPFILELLKLPVPRDMQRS